MHNEFDLQFVDMLFKCFCSNDIAAHNNTLQGYYDQEYNPAMSEFAGTIPSGVDLVYWDYYHTASDAYSQKIKQHRELGCESPWVASRWSL